MIFSSLKNRVHSRTRVTTIKFQSALNLKNRLRSRTRVTTSIINYVLEARLRACIQRAVIACINAMLNPNTKWSQIGIRSSETRNAPRGTKSSIFAKGIFQPFNLPKSCPNPVREPSLLRIRRLIYI